MGGAVVFVILLLDWRRLDQALDSWGNWGKQMLGWKQQAPEWWESGVTFRLQLRGVRKINIFSISFIFM